MSKVLALFLPLLVNLDASVTITTGQPLATLTVQTTNAELELIAVDITAPDASWISRGYNGNVLGPLIRTSAGETLTINLTNSLGEDSSASQHNEFHHPNHTNVHTHGLHITGEAPADDVFIDVAPGEGYNYSYNIPTFHMGGTQWYHPHRHGSTSIQAGGGAAGVLIVDDAEGEVPPEIANMEEVVMMFQHLPMASLVTIEENSAGDLWKVTGTAADHVLINGHIAPTIAMVTNKWYRWRMVFASVEATIRLAFSDTTNCEMQLLAKDGIYLHHAPRLISVVPFPLGGRADVAVRCTAAGSYTLESEEGVAGGAGKGRRRLHQMGENAGDFVGSLATITVADGSETATTLPGFSVRRPCYLADLRCAEATEVDSTFTVALRPFTVNDQAFVDSDTPLTGGSFATGSLLEWTITGTGGHPFHLHVNPYQIQTLTTTDTDYFQVGDWHDVVLGPSALKVRIQTDTFVSKAVIHCHVLEHEDQGMMGFVELTGTEGDTWDYAETIDSTCHRDGTRAYNLTSETGPTCSNGVPDPVDSHASVVAPSLFVVSAVLAMHV